MDIACKDAFAKAKELIEKRKQMYGDHIIPEVQEMDGGNLFVQYFEDWFDYENQTKRRNIDLVNPIDEILESYMIFTGKNNIIDENEFEVDRVYTMLNGDVEILINDTKIPLHSFQTIEIPAGIKHSIKTVNDAYYIVVEK